MNKTLLALFTSFALAACGNQTADNAAASTSSTVASTANNGLSLMGSDLRQEHMGGDFTLTDGNGNDFTLSSLQGKAVVLTFGFTHCPDVCPTELLAFNDAVKQMGEQAKDVAVIFVSVDPERDTPELIGQYVQQFNPDFIGLTAVGEQELAAVKQQYRVVSAKTEIKSDTQYNVDHTAGAYILDTKGNLVAFEPYGVDAAQLANDLKFALAQ